MGKLKEEVSIENELSGSLIDNRDFDVVWEGVAFPEEDDGFGVGEDGDVGKP